MATPDFNVHYQHVGHDVDYHYGTYVLLVYYTLGDYGGLYTSAGFILADYKFGRHNSGGSLPCAGAYAGTSCLGRGRYG